MDGCLKMININWARFRWNRAILIYFAVCLILLSEVLPISPVLAAAEEWRKPYEQAMNWVKEEKYNQALPLLAQLQEKYPSVPQLYFDRSVVLHWAGKDKEATALYEAKIAGRRDIPAYVMEAAANAYFRQGNYASAQMLYHVLSANGDRRARRAGLLEAESLIRQNNPAEAQKIYEALLKENPNDEEVYLARGRARLEKGDSWKSIQDFVAAQAIITRQGDLEKKKQVDSLLSATCIRVGDWEQAVATLLPYIKNGQADPAMQSDYVAALRMSGSLDQTIAEANRLWPDLQKAPPSGVRTLGDAYLLGANYDEAIRVYNIALKNDPKNYPAILGLAAARVQKGQLPEALPMYDQVLAQSPRLAEIVLDDCLYLMSQGKTGAAQRIFAVLAARIPAGSPFYRQYADKLKTADFPKDAYRNFQVLRGQ